MKTRFAVGGLFISFLLLIFLQPRFKTSGSTQPDGVGGVERKFRYYGWENTVFYVEPQGHISSTLTINGQSIRIGEKQKIPRLPTVFDAKPHLIRGENTIRAVNTRSPLEHIYLGPRLTAHGSLYSIAGWLTWILALITVSLLLRRSRWETWERQMMAAAFGYFSLWLILRSNLIYTGDLQDHVNYIHHVKTHWLTPFSYDGWESFQPPSYYYAAALAATAAEQLRVFNPLSAIRLLSLGFYAIFMGAAFLTLQETSVKEKSAYVMAAVQLIFWPASILMATRINNDIPAYAAWSVSFLFLMRWVQTKQMRSLTSAVLVAGLGVLIKASLLAMGFIIFAVMLVKISEEKIPIRTYTHRRFLLAAGIAVACVAFFYLQPAIKMALHGIDHPIAHVPGPRPYDFGFGHFLTFNLKDFFGDPFLAPWKNRPDMPYLNYFFKTALFGELQFSHPGLARWVGAFFLTYVGVAVIAIAGLIKAEKEKTLPWLLAIVIPLSLSVAFTVKEQSDFCQDFRLIYPMYVPAVILAAQGLQRLRDKGWTFLYWTGWTAGIGFPLIAVVFYLRQIV